MYKPNGLVAKNFLLLLDCFAANWAASDEQASANSWWPPITSLATLSQGYWAKNPRDRILTRLNNAAEVAEKLHKTKPCCSNSGFTSCLDWNRLATANYGWKPGRSARSDGIHPWFKLSTFRSPQKPTLDFLDPGRG